MSRSEPTWWASMSCSGRCNATDQMTWQDDLDILTLGESPGEKVSSEQMSRKYLNIPDWPQSLHSNFKQGSLPGWIQITCSQSVFPVCVLTMHEKVRVVFCSAEHRAHVILYKKSSTDFHNFWNAVRQCGNPRTFTLLDQDKNPLYCLVF